MSSKGLTTLTVSAISIIDGILNANVSRYTKRGKYSTIRYTVHKIKGKCEAYPWDSFLMHFSDQYEGNFGSYLAR